MSFRCCNVSLPSIMFFFLKWRFFTLKFSASFSTSPFRCENALNILHSMAQGWNISWAQKWEMTTRDLKSVILKQIPRPFLSPRLTIHWTYLPLSSSSTSVQPTDQVCLETMTGCFFALLGQELRQKQHNIWDSSHEDLEFTKDDFKVFPWKDIEVMYNSGGEVYTLNDLGLSFPTALIWGFPITYDNPPQSTYTKQLIEKRVGGAGKMPPFS